MNEQNFDNDYYYSLNPDVRKSVIAGRFTSGYEHYIKHGRYEGRQAKTIEVVVASSQYIVLTDNSSGLKFRLGVRDGGHVIDKELTPTGFNGNEGVDWEKIGGAN